MFLDELLLDLLTNGKGAAAADLKSVFHFRKVSVLWETPTHRGLESRVFLRQTRWHGSTTWFNSRSTFHLKHHLCQSLHLSLNAKTGAWSVLQYVCQLERPSVLCPSFSISPLSSRKWWRECVHPLRSQITIMEQLSRCVCVCVSNLKECYCTSLPALGQVLPVAYNNLFHTVYLQGQGN